MTSTTEWRDADKKSIDAWLNLHLLARRMPAGEDSRVLADAALARVIPLAAELPEDVPFVGVHAPTKPSAGVIEPWIELVEELSGTPESGTLLATGVELGLLGADRRIDERAAAVIAEGFELDTVQGALTEIGRQALLDPLIGSIAEQLAETVANDLTRRPLLRELCKNDQALVALKRTATAHPSLAVMSVYLWAVVDRYPDRRGQSAKTLLMLDPHAVGDVRALWGDDGPQTKEEHAELLRVFHDAERRPPELDVKRASALLMEESIEAPDKGDPLALALRGLPNHLELPAYCAWYASARRPGSTHRFDAWGRVAARALAPNHEVPPLRSEELLTIVAHELVSPQTLEGYFDAIERLREATGTKRFDEAMTFALTNALHDAEDPLELLAVTFSIWAKAPNGTGHSLHDEVLAPAARPYRRDDDEIRSHLGPRRQAEWDEFTARHSSKSRRFLPRLRSRAR
ncbi:hypothetical protein OJ998_16420 [Solirubrobacter taibaiensis]|nr:hypothetical protein [Solirubrobacter taibaiensis]